ncbi:MAG: hypothetical protein HC905_22990 [Bacteroidales bacterium]|nr:hypothetical protein [Bacteroidales bacterium]
MKTRNFKPIVLVILSFISFTITAQNTRKIKLANYSVNNSALKNKIDVTVSGINDELTLQVDKLGESFKFKPKEDDKLNPASTKIEFNEDFSADLERFARYYPENDIDPILAKNVTESEFEEITHQLLIHTIYSPKESIYSPENEFLENLMQELSEYARFKPSSI